jgi:hypothetical protein
MKKMKDQEYHILCKRIEKLEKRVSKLQASFAGHMKRKYFVIEGKA